MLYGIFLIHTTYGQAVYMLYGQKNHPYNIWKSCQYVVRKKTCFHTTYRNIHMLYVRLH